MTVNQFIVTGVVKSVVDKVTGGGKQFCKILMSVRDDRANGSIVEMPVELTAWGKAAQSAKDLRDGDLVAIAGKVSGREHEGRCYVELCAISIKHEPQQVSQSKPAATVEEQPF